MVHECVIGLYQRWDERYLVTLEDLEEEIENNIKFAESFADRHGCKPGYVYTLKDYGNRRKNTDLIRFTNCPYCGEQIDWKMIRSIGNEKNR